METRPAANGRRLGLRRARPARPGDSTARVTASAGRSGEGDPGAGRRWGRAMRGSGAQGVPCPEQEEGAVLVRTRQPSACSRGPPGRRVAD
ncbi:putative uncharacterized protein BRD3OS isoform X1 [Pipistrellus kuhlii]|uniref:putative uncharacterized protein BRD3OS isoform X1 n=1 Tax=Pipistrellus kuhlii TaxID=59472 RepID=UPI001E2701AE|nr:putative uncharacterized protein BRD3OS isoform X1 [Pipistrellus kuhlii]